MADLRTQREKEYQTELEKRLPAIIKMLPPYLPTERFQMLARALLRNPDLINCTPSSLVDCVAQAAEKGLEIGGPNKHCAIVRFKSTAVLIPQWQGKAFLWIKSGAIRKLTADVIYKGDYYKVRLGDDESIEHHPDVESDRSPAWLNNMDNIVGAYAIATLPSGDKQHSFVSRAHLVRLREWVKKKNEGEGFGWRDWLPEMAKKTAVHRLDGYIQPPAEMTEEQREAWSRAERTIEVDAVTVEEREDQNLPGETGRQLREQQAKVRVVEEPEVVVVEEEDGPIGATLADEILDRNKVKATRFIAVAKEMGYADFTAIPRSKVDEFERRLREG